MLYEKKDIPLNTTSIYIFRIIYILYFLWSVVGPEVK